MSGRIVCVQIPYHLVVSSTCLSGSPVRVLSHPVVSHIMPALSMTHVSMMSLLISPLVPNPCALGQQVVESVRTRIQYYG